MKILTWNIQSGGGRRLPLIAQKLFNFETDIFIASEFRANRHSAAFIDSMRDKYPYHVKADSHNPNVNSIAIFSRHAFTRLPCQAEEKNRHRFICIRVNKLIIIGAYFAQGMQKKSQFDYLIKDAKKNGTKNKIIIGDLNTGDSDLDSQHSSFYCEDEFSVLANGLYSDAYRYKNGKKKEYSWWSNYGNGYRIDHCLCDRSLVKTIIKCNYIQKWKEDGSSDHVPLLVEFKTI